MLQPIVRNLDLGPVFYDLTEDSVLIPDTIAPGRVIEGRQGIQEASSQSAQTSVTQSWVDLLVGNPFERVAQISQGLFVLILQIKIDKSVAKTSANQKLQRQVVDFLFARTVEHPVAVVETLNESVPN